MKTRAAVMYEHNEPVVVEELELDEPKANEVPRPYRCEWGLPL